MPLTECPDCGGVVSDAALTCPTCHRVLKTMEPGGVKVARNWGTCFALGVLVVLIVWVTVNLLT